jgi:hypothetical protein
MTIRWGMGEPPAWPGTMSDANAALTYFSFSKSIART